MQVGLCLLTAFCCLKGMHWRDSDLLFILIQIFINFMGIPFLRLISSHRQYTIKEHLSVSKFYLVWHFEIKSNVLDLSKVWYDFPDVFYFEKYVHNMFLLYLIKDYFLYFHCHSGPKR